MSGTATATRAAAGSPQLSGRDKTPAGRRRRRLLVGLVVGILVVLLAVGGWLVLFSSVLAVRQVSIAGATDLTPAQVRDAAQVPLGRPLARQDLTAIAQRTTQLPQVAQARVSRDWPNTIEIVVLERRPVLAVAQPQGFLMIDETGVAYEIRSSVPKGVQQVDVNPGDGRLLADVAVVSAALPGSLRSRVNRIAAISRDDITLRLDSGVVVTWGSSAESALKVQVTEALLNRKPRATIDVSSPHNPAFR